MWQEQGKVEAMEANRLVGELVVAVVGHDALSSVKCDCAAPAKTRGPKKHRKCLRRFHNKRNTPRLAAHNFFFFFSPLPLLMAEAPTFDRCNVRACTAEQFPSFLDQVMRGQSGDWGERGTQGVVPMESQAHWKQR